MGTTTGLIQCQHSLLWDRVYCCWWSLCYNIIHRTFLFSAGKRAFWNPPGSTNAWLYSSSNFPWGPIVSFLLCLGWPRSIVDKQQRLWRKFLGEITGMMQRIFLAVWICNVELIFFDGIESVRTPWVGSDSSTWRLEKIIPPVNNTSNTVIRKTVNGQIQNQLVSKDNFLLKLVLFNFVLVQFCKRF